jgi:hypothetical protein
MSNPQSQPVPRLRQQYRYRCADGTTYSADATGTLHSVLDKHVAELTANGFSNRHPRDLANPNNGNQAGKWGNG